MRVLRVVASLLAGAGYAVFLVFLLACVWFLADELVTLMFDLGILRWRQ